MADLRAGLLGAGMMGRNHARVLASLPGVQLVAVADEAGDPYRVAGDLLITGGVDELIDAGVDYVVVAAPTAVHTEAGLKLAAAGVHALIEKPLAADTAGATALAEAFTAAGLVGAVGHIERYNPALQQARARIEAGELGEIYQVVTRRQGPFPGRIADVGVVKDLATHDIDLTAWVTQREFVRVSANVGHRSGRQHEDLVSVSGLLSGGIVTSHLVNWLSPFKERVTVITGERGSFVADTLTADLTFHANAVVNADGSRNQMWDSLAVFRGVAEGDVTRFAFSKAEPLRTEHENFRNAVLGEPADIVTMAQGLEVVRVAEAIIESARTGEVVEL